MLRIIVVIISVWLLVVSTATSIEKVSAQNKPKQGQISTNNDKKGESEILNPTQPEPPTDQKDYNDFVDKNNNGIDDRMESKKNPSVDPQPDNDNETGNTTTPSDTTKSDN
ncbi:MAG: hypothetical protein ABIJ45_07340 [Candidatus Zixiibacteriota bacterium]